MRRVVITGLGTINALGNDVETTWARLLRGENGVGPITRFDSKDHVVHFAASVELDLAKHFAVPDLRKYDLFTMWALLASDEALRDAGFDLATIDEPIRERFGSIIGTGIGGITGIEAQHAELLERGPRRVSPHFVPKIMANAVSGQVAIRHGLLGTCFTTSSACASSGHSMGMAWRAIQWGDADVVVTGGSESATTPLSLAGFGNMKALSQRNEDPGSASRPFDKDRDGFVIGEGAGLLVLETEEHARRRGATAICELVGYGASGDAFHMTSPCLDGDGAARAMKRALQDAGMALDEVMYINSHGTSTPAGDPIEVTAVKTVFGEHARRLMMGSTKSMTGHLLGAAGGLEAVVTALVLARGVVPPTINLDTPDEACDLDFIPNQARTVKVKAALSNSFGFGGHNVTLAMKAIA